MISDEQQRLLDGVQLRLIKPGEQERFDQLIIQEHYLKNAQLVGEQLRYVAEYDGQWVGLMAWSAGAYKLKAREEWIGWSPAQKKRRLPLVVNHSRFLILKDFHVPNLASRLMKRCLQRLSQDWAGGYGHEVLIAETFVDPQHFLGTCYKASGWSLLGKTQGYKRSRRDFYQAHDQAKTLWVRELRPGARTILRGRNLPQALQAVAQNHPPPCEESPEELRKMRGFFGGLTDWRKRQPEFPLSSLVALSVCALLCKVCLGQRDLAAFAADLTVDQMEALGFPRDWTRRPHRHYRPPGESSFFRLLSNLKNDQLEKALLDWQDHVLGKRNPAGDQVSVDGKELLNSQGLQIVSAYSVSDGRWLGSEAVEEKSNEIPAVQHLLQRVDMEGSLVTADALHTQTKTAQIIVQDKGGDFLFTGKGNQKGVCQNVQQLYKGLSHALSPSGSNGLRPNLRAQPQPNRSARFDCFQRHRHGR
ncbi:MAG: ISAs1 family transposase [Limisphaerales bacterium]